MTQAHGNTLLLDSGARQHLFTQAQLVAFKHAPPNRSACRTRLQEAPALGQMHAALNEVVGRLQVHLGAEDETS